MKSDHTLNRITLCACVMIAEQNTRHGTIGGIAYRLLDTKNGSQVTWFGALLQNQR